jgi:alkylation response protein AidB-like acyl-CoA dehydrogenase
MHRRQTFTGEASRRAESQLRDAAARLVTGLLTGFFGVGGGFVIIPPLLLLLGLPDQARRLNLARGRRDDRHLALAHSWPAAASTGGSQPATARREP